MRLHYSPNQYSQQRQKEKKVWVYPVLLAMEAEFHRRQGREVVWDAETGRSIPEGIPFLSLPSPDRVFTKATDKKYQIYGNYKHHPATHMLVADGCWHGKCGFCVENKKTYQVRDLGSVTDEIIECIRLGFKEIFDDSGTFPTGKWLDDFCKLWKDNKAVTFGCNMRICDVDFKAMKNAGFRMVLFGVESHNQKTLDKIKKGIKADEIIPTIRRASEAGLEPHIAVMLGYPWEGEYEELKTLDMVKELLRKGYAKTAQASIYSVSGQHSIDRGFTKKIYEAAYYPDFWFHQIKDIKSFNDAKYLLRKIKAGIWR